MRGLVQTRDRVIVALLACLLGSCTAFISRTEYSRVRPQPLVYAGMAGVIAEVRLQPDLRELALVLLDAPATLVADTLMVPIDVAVYLARRAIERERESLAPKGESADR